MRLQKSGFSNLLHKPAFLHDVLAQYFYALASRVLPSSQPPKPCQLSQHLRACPGRGTTRTNWCVLIHAPPLGHLLHQYDYTQNVTLSYYFVGEHPLVIE